MPDKLYDQKLNPNLEIVAYVREERLILKHGCDQYYLFYGAAIKKYSSVLK